MSKDELKPFLTQDNLYVEPVNYEQQSSENLSLCFLSIYNTNRIINIVYEYEIGQVILTLIHELPKASSHVT